MSFLSWLTGRGRDSDFRAFSKYVDPDLIQRIIDHPEDLGPSSCELEVGFVFIRVRDDRLEIMDDLLDHVTEAALKANGWIEACVGPVVVVTFGARRYFHQAAGDLAAAMPPAVDALRVKVGESGVILYGTRTARVGSYGGENRFNFGSVFPGYSGVLRELNTAPLGTVKEFEADANGGGNEKNLVR